MRSYFATIVNGFGSILDFRGRTSRKGYWPYVLSLLLVLVVSAQILGGLAMQPFVAAMEQYQRDHPGSVDIQTGPAGVSVRAYGAAPPDMLSFMSTMLSVVLVGAAIFILLIAAATVRRLHDTGRSGAWALLPLPWLAAGLTGMAYLLQSDERTMSVFGLLFLNNMLYLASLFRLIVLLARRSDPALNRFGAPPA